MRVNSSLTGFFAGRFMNRCSVTIVVIAIFFMSSAFTDDPDRDLRAKQVNLMIRLIGHQLLWQAGDSTSMVMPVTEVRKGTFLLQFENNFVFSHDSLMAMAWKMLPKTQFPSGYTVTVLDCMNADIVYGFQLNNASPDLMSCQGRRQPLGCYVIEFTFPDFFERVELTDAGIDKPNEESKSFKTDRQASNRKFEEAKTENDINQLIAEVKTPNVYPPQAGLKTAEFETPTHSFSFVNLVYSGMLVSLGVTLLIARFGNILSPKLTAKQSETVTKDSVAEFAGLGKFLFDVKGQRLLMGSEVISLTDKECKILELLNTSFGQLTPRETLMEKVWINEGVITGRSLDMFVSKLRKKLSGDPELKITNVHGKGYTLESTVVRQ